MNLVIIIAAVLLLGSTARADVSRLGPDSLRVWEVRPDTFDYVFASYSEAVDGDWHLALNDRSGRTHFVRVGEMLGHFRVCSFEPFEASVHVPELNALQSRKSGRVTLEGPGGLVHVLNQGQLLETGGYRAIIISTAGRYYWSVREGDRFSEGVAGFSVLKILPETVILDSGGLPVTIPPALPEERTQLAEKWKSQAIALREARAAAAARVPEEQAERGSRIETSSRLPATEFFVGREVRIPSEYGVMFVPDGTGGWRPVVFPRKFQTYYDAVRWGRDGMVVEQPPSFAPSWYLPRGSSGGRVSFPSVRVKE